MTGAVLTGPLASEVYDTGRTEPSWWEATTPPARPRPLLEGEVKADVAIIGGGYAGLASAKRFAELGLDAVVLEAGEIGWGASGRNGGMVCIGGHKLSERAMARQFGEDEVGRYYRLQVEGIHQLRTFCETQGLGDAVQGDGEILLAHSPGAAQALLHETGGHGIEVEHLPPEPSGDIRARGGVILRPGFGIHPLRLVRRLAETAEEAGAWVHPHTPVLGWSRETGLHRLQTPSGEVSAGRVVVATNGFTPDGLDPRLDGRAVPVISNIAVTRPLRAAERAALPWLGDTPASDTRNLLAYFRLLPEGRLLLGMRGDLFGTRTGRARMRRAVAHRIGQAMPVLEDIEITHFWRGPICATARRTPAVGRLADDPSVGHAFGWHGAGINLAQIGGRLVAEVMAGAKAGDAHIPAPMRGATPRLPLPGLRPFYVGAMQSWLGLRDRLT